MQLVGRDYPPPLPPSPPSVVGGRMSKYAASEEGLPPPPPPHHPPSRENSGMWNYTPFFNLETVTGEIFSKQEELVICICRFGESLQSWCRNARICVRVNETFSDDFLV